MAQESEKEFLVPLALPLTRHTVTYTCARKRFLKASKRAAKAMTIFGTGWQVDGHTSTRLFLKRVVPIPENMGVTPQAEFDLSFEGSSTMVSIFSRLESEKAIFENFTREVQRALDQYI